MEKKKIMIHGTLHAIEASRLLIEKSQSFTVEPFPNDDYEYTVAKDIAPTIIHLEKRVY